MRAFDRRERLPEIARGHKRIPDDEDSHATNITVAPGRLKDARAAWIGQYDRDVSDVGGYATFLAAADMYGRFIGRYAPSLSAGLRTCPT